MQNRVARTRWEEKDLYCNKTPGAEIERKKAVTVYGKAWPGICETELAASGLLVEIRLGEGRHSQK